MIFGKYFTLWKHGDNLYIVQVRKNEPLFAIVTSYFSDDAGTNLSYTSFAIPRKYKTEPPL